jgi:hypothetical protein
VQQLAKRVADTLSFSVSHWREDGQILAPPWAPVRLQVDAGSPSAPRLAPLLEALAVLLATAYSTDRWPRSAAIVLASPNGPADVRILLVEQWAQDRHRLVYEARFPHSEAVFRGLFTLG